MVCALETADGSLTIFHPVHGQTYKSLSGALGEARNLYLEGSGFSFFVQELLPSIPKTTIRILDVGLGLGYNALSTISLWESSATSFDLHLVSLEVDQKLFSEFLSQQSLWQKNWPQDWLKFLPMLKQVGDNLWTCRYENKDKGHLIWDIYLSDYSQEASFPDSFPASFDYIWHDPFSREHNPTMWDVHWFQKVFAYTLPQTVLMTYSVCRAVRDALSDAGFFVQKIKAKASQKRDWLKATRL